MSDEIDNETAKKVIMEFGMNRPDEHDLLDMKLVLQAADLVPAKLLRDAEARAERDEALIRLHGVLWLLVEEGVISDSKARTLGNVTPDEMRGTIKRIVENT